jgi:hypothetical protein
LDLFIRGRMGSVAEGVASLVEDKEPEPPPSGVAIFIVYAALFGALALQISGMVHSISALRRRRVPTGRFGRKSRIGLALFTNLAWAVLVLVLIPKQLGLPLTTLAGGLPDLAYLLLASGLVALVWAVARTVWAFLVLRPAAAA